MFVTERLYAVGIVLLVAFLYLAVIRLLDVNEREPLWTTTLLFVLGLTAAALLHLIVQSPVLHLSVLPAAILRRGSTFVAIAVGLAILSASTRRHGWSELNGMMDGIVYGAAAGLGFATGEILVQQLRTPTVALLAEINWLVVVWTSALTGLAHAVFGALSGAGFGAATQSPRPGRWLLYPATGLAVAIAADAGHDVLAYANSLGGASAVLRSWIALLLPLAIVGAIGLYAFRTETRTIETQLGPEIEAGVITHADLELIRRAGKRHLLYCKTFFSGHLTHCSELMSLHHRQVLLALAKHQAARESNEQRKNSILAVVQRLRGELTSSGRRDTSVSTTPDGPPPSGRMTP